MSTSFVTTAVEKADHQIRDVTVRNRLLDALTVSSGAVDTVSFIALGKVFSAFMTGNIAFLGMAIASTTGSTTYGVIPPRVISVLAAMAGFAAGIYLATKIVRRFEQSAANKNQQPTGVVWPRHRPGATAATGRRPGRPISTRWRWMRPEPAPRRRR